MVIRTVQTNGQAKFTGPLMHEMVERYRHDMTPFALMSAVEVFDILAHIPFRPDPPDCEMLQRPYYTLSESGYGGDCDDKSICMAAWASLNRIPYRFVAVRRADRKVLHHVYTELYIKGKWVPFDCTFSYNLPGRTLHHYAERVVIWPSNPQ